MEQVLVLGVRRVPCSPLTTLLVANNSEQTRLEQRPKKDSPTMLVIEANAPTENRFLAPSLGTHVDLGAITKCD